MYLISVKENRLQRHLIILLNQRNAYHIIHSRHLFPDMLSGPLGCKAPFTNVTNSSHFIMEVLPHVTAGRINKSNEAWKGCIQSPIPMGAHRL